MSQEQREEIGKLEERGKILEDWWIDIYPVDRVRKERLGYPTQKPTALLERIIKASSNEEDIVLDSFCGCGTAIDAAQKLGRHWLGIDVTWLAIDLVEKRLKAVYGSKVDGKYEVHGKPYDVASAQALANKSKKEFEIWAVTSVGAAPREYDGGVDGIFGFVEKDKKVKTIIVQVKGGDVLNPGMVRDLIGTVKKKGAAIGLFLTLKEPSTRMKALVATMGKLAEIIYHCLTRGERYEYQQKLGDRSFIIEANPVTLTIAYRAEPGR